MYVDLGVISEERMSSGFLISIEFPQMSGCDVPILDELTRVQALSLVNTATRKLFHLMYGCGRKLDLQESGDRVIW
jgi:hypothetical protein